METKLSLNVCLQLIYESLKYYIMVYVLRHGDRSLVRDLKSIAHQLLYLSESLLDST